MRPVAWCVSTLQGSLQQTGNDLDIGVDGAGFFVLLPDGTTAYTRDGSFQKGNQGPARDFERLQFSRA